MREFFTTAGYALSDCRRRMLLTNLEAQSFFPPTGAFWAIKDVHRAIENSRGTDDDGEDCEINNIGTFNSSSR